MKFLTTATLTLITSATFASAEGKIDELCGAGHPNEVQSQLDVIANPDGYFIRNLNIQVSHGDPRLIQAVGKEYHLCTRGAATPDMATTMAHNLMNEREVKFLFIPTCPKIQSPGA